MFSTRCVQDPNSQRSSPGARSGGTRLLGPDGLPLYHGRKRQGLNQGPVKETHDKSGHILDEPFSLSSFELTVGFYIGDLRVAIF